MAKAKSSSTTPAAAKKTATQSAAEAKSAPKAPAKKAAAKKPAPVAAQTGMPQIDTNLAAQSAATMLRNRGALSGASASQGAKTETSTFKNLKDQIANPKSAALSNIMGTPGEQKKGGSHFMNQQRGHNQTQGGFNKTGVPRRTNG
jgi:hypothetical protein